MQVFTVIALTFHLIGTYIVWPSRWNIPAHLQLGLCVTGYLIPGLATDVWNTVDASTNLLFSQINIVGAFGIAAGLVAGVRVNLFGNLGNRLLTIYKSPTLQSSAMLKVQRVALAAVIGMIVAYIIMGFVPMFTADPFSARQFKNEYAEPYHRADYLYRASFSALTELMPLLFTLWWIKRRPQALILACSAVVVIALSLSRGPAAIGFIVFLGLVAAQRNKGVKWYIGFNTLIWPIGSVVFLLLGVLTGVDRYSSIYTTDGSIAGLIAAGSPDIQDQLGFLSGFKDLGYNTLGRTFYGGLIPGNYMWNPSVWSLTYDDLGADITSIASGGLRLSIALQGYSAFSWVGAFLIPFISGVINGSLIRILKRLPLSSALWPTALIFSLYMTVGSQLTEFYSLSIHRIPAMACSLYLCWAALQKRPTQEQALAAV